MIIFYNEEIKKQSLLLDFIKKKTPEGESNAKLFAQLIEHQLSTLNLIISAGFQPQEILASNLLNHYLLIYKNQQSLFTQLGFSGLMEMYLPEFQSSLLEETSTTTQLNVAPPSSTESQGCTHQVFPAIADSFLMSDPPQAETPESDRALLPETHTARDIEPDANSPFAKLLYVEGKFITKNAFLKRLYYIKGDPTERELTSKELSNANIDKDGTPWLDGKMLIWKRIYGVNKNNPDSKKNKSPRSNIVFVDGKIITRDTFNKRSYYIEGDSTKTKLTYKELKRAHIDSEGIAWFEGKKITWDQKNSLFLHKDSRILVEGVLITKQAFQKRSYCYADDPEEKKLTKKELAQVHLSSDGSVSLAGRPLKWIPQKRQANTVNGVTTPWQRTRNSQKILIDGQKITLRGFKMRTYYYRDNPTQLVTDKEKERYNIQADGTIHIDGRPIIWIKNRTPFNNKDLYFFSKNKRDRTTNTQDEQEITAEQSSKKARHEYQSPDLATNQTAERAISDRVSSETPATMNGVTFSQSELISAEKEDDEEAGSIDYSLDFAEIIESSENRKEQNSVKNPYSFFEPPASESPAGDESLWLSFDENNSLKTFLI